jgi:hypothetical protein
MIATRIVCLVALVALFSYGEAFEPVGTWSVIANGYSGSLYIGEVDTSGDLLDATFFGQTVEGFWSEYENKITFIRVITAGAISSWQTYVGFYYVNSATGYATLSGYFEAFPGTDATYLVNRFGWTASLGSLGSTTPILNPSSFATGTWTVNANGYANNLVLDYSSGPSSGGTLTGTWGSVSISTGFYNIQSQSIVYPVDNNDAYPTNQQIYYGYLSEYETSSGAVYQALSGYFVAFAGTGATADVTEYGWSAYQEI